MPKAKQSKSAQIRQLLEHNPTMLVKDVVSTLSAKGVKVPPSMVYYVRAKGKRRIRRQKVGQMATRNGATSPVDLIVKVRGLAREAGGYDQLKQLVDILAAD